MMVHGRFEWWWFLLSNWTHLYERKFHYKHVLLDRIVQLARLNPKTNMCDRYRYQPPPGAGNHSCGGADVWAAVVNSREVFCPARLFCRRVLLTNERTVEDDNWNA